jgi:NAD(P)-dependent dehydrogenase (short-subunit alcohol dehydrogenase family)
MPIASLQLKKFSDSVFQLLRQPTSAIGCNPSTHSDSLGEGGFETARCAERNGKVGKEMTATLENLRVLVTGGGSAIGGEIARQYAEAGARVHICDIVQDHLDQQLREKAITGTLADVSDLAAMDHLFADVQAKLGGLDVVVNNAGITGPMGPIEDILPTDWERTYDINVKGMFFCLRRGVPMLKAAGGGLVINISSVAGRLGYPLRTAYSSSKWAVIGLTQSLAMELGPHNIRVNAILPGWTAGERHDRNIHRRAPALDLEPEEMRAKIYSRISMRGTVSTSDIAATAVFLASPGGRSISGQSLGVCGNVETLAI